MPKGRNRKRSGVEPTAQLRTFITYHLQPEDVLDEDDYIEKMLLVRYRIICIFGRSIDPVTKRGVLGNYLLGIGPRVSMLNKYLFTRINPKGILVRSDLPKSYQMLEYKWREKIINRVLKIMIERQVSLMKETCDLWWLDYHGGIWEICQSVADEQKLTQAAFATIYDAQYSSNTRPRYYDERTHHGRPSKQSRRRNRQLGQAPGVSIGY